jgi:flagellar basal-body rod protein FlgB
VDGNNVDVDVELTQMAETGVRYQAFTQLITKKYQDLRSIVKGG